MAVEWDDVASDVVDAPVGMVVLGGKVHRRVWRTPVFVERGCESRRFYELSLYMGRDEDGFIVVRWSCQVRDGELALDYMTSAVKPYGWSRSVDAGMVRRVVKEVAPIEVTGYAVWGSLMFSRRKKTA